MLSLLMRFFGKRAVHQAVARQSGSGGMLDIKLGMALLRDRRVSVFTKLLALGIGAGLIALLIDMEVPMEALLALFLPLIGFALDGIADTLEAVIGPFVIAALLLPHLVPAPLVARIRDERNAVLTADIVEEARPAFSA